MEVGQAVLALDLVDTEPDLAERVVLILLQIGQRDLEYSAFQCIVGVLETGGTVDEGLSDASLVLVLSAQWVDGEWRVRTLGRRMWWAP